MIRRIFSAIAGFILGSLLSVGLAGNGPAFIERTPFGTVDWDTGAIVVRGVGAPSQKDDGQSATANARILADARFSARENLNKMIDTICIDASRDVAGIVSTQASLGPQIAKMIQAAREIEDRRKYLSDGSVEIFLQFQLFGGFAQLILPAEIHQIQPIKPVMPKTRPVDPQKSDKLPEMQAFTGLIVDARGVDLVPAMAPRIFDETGQEVYGASFVSREYTVQAGVSAYLIDLDSAGSRDRIGNRPLIVRGLRVLGQNRCDIVISNADAAKLRRSSEHLEFLKQARVMVVVGAGKQ